MLDFKLAPLTLLACLQCVEIAQHLAGDMAREDLRGKTLTLKLKTTAFEVRTRAHSLPQYISTFEEIVAPAMRLLKAEMPIEIRLMGMRMSHFLEVRKDSNQKSIAGFVLTTQTAATGQWLVPVCAIMCLQSCFWFTGQPGNRQGLAVILRKSLWLFLQCCAQVLAQLGCQLDASCPALAL